MSGCYTCKTSSALSVVLRMDFQSLRDKGFLSSWPEEVTGEGRVRGRVVVGPAVVSVCICCIFAPLPGLAPSPLSPGLLGSFAAQGWKRHATVEERGVVGRGENRKLALRDTRSALCFLSFLTSTSPVSFSLRTKLSRCRSGPAFNLRRRGRSCRGSFWNRSAGAVTTANEMIMENKAVFSPNKASFPHLVHRGASACTMRTCRDCPKP